MRSELSHLLAFLPNSPLQLFTIQTMFSIVPQSRQRVGDLSRLRQTSQHLETVFVESLRDHGIELRDLGPVTVSQGDTFEQDSGMVTMMDFSGEVSGFAAVVTDPRQIRRFLGEDEQWLLGDITEDMLQEFVNQSTQCALELVRTEDGIISCSAPRTIYGSISIPKIPCVTRSYRESPIQLSFSMALDRMESDLMRLNRALITREQALRSEIERRRVAEQRLELLASTDVLTGSTTRRKFLEVSEQLVDQARNSEGALSMILADVDHFKKINDTYGHAGGDTVLRMLGHFLKENARKVDIVGRLGGEEFGICLPETNLSQAKILADRICSRLAEQDITLEDGKLLRCTISLGVAQLQPSDKDIGALMHRADMAMYQSKRNGRNQAICAA